MDKDGYPWWSLWENICSWWDIRHLPNVQLIHFARLREDLSGEMRRIAVFLDIPVDETKWESTVEHCTFKSMKREASKIAPLGGSLWEGGAQTFINKGTNGRWRNMLTDEDIANYEQTAVERLGEECARWLATGDGGD